MLPNHLRTIAKQMDAAETGYFILGDGTRLPVASLHGEILNAMRFDAPLNIRDARRHLFTDKPVRNRTYNYKFALNIGKQIGAVDFSTGAWDPDAVSSHKYVSFMAPGWTLSEVVNSDTVYNKEHAVTLLINGKTLPETAKQALIGQPLLEIIDLPKEYGWTRALQIESITETPSGSTTTISLKTAQTPTIIRDIKRIEPATTANAAANQILQNTRKDILELMKERHISRGALADKMKINEKTLGKALRNDNESLTIAMVARILHALEAAPELKIHQ